MSDMFCLRCGTGVQDWDTAYYARNMFCITCYQAKVREASTAPCSKCGVRTNKDELKFFREKSLCPYCLRESQQEAHDKECAICKKWIEDWEEKFKMPDGSFACRKCHDSSKGKFGVQVCSHCGKSTDGAYFAPDGKIFCQVCVLKYAKPASRPLLARVVTKFTKLFSAEV